MKRTTIGAILVILLVMGAFFTGDYVGKRYTVTKMNPLPNYQEVVDSLNNTKDSIKNQIDTIYINLNEVDQDYVEAIRTVLAHDPDESVCFFLEYIGSQKQRLDSINSAI